MALPPSATALGRLRNRALNTLAKKLLFRDTQKLAESIMSQLGAAPLRAFAMDLSREFDRFLQLGPAALEYPRGDISDNLAFVGVLPDAPSTAPTPDWWPLLDGSRPVVHVTQGTIDNHDFSRLVLPTIAALADSPVTVVVSLGGRPAEELGDVPGNVLVAPYLDYAALLPLTDVFITNGGFGGVLQALRHGIPVIVAGDTEDKPEVAARIAWSGVGVNLRTGTPRASSIAAAVTDILDTPRFANRALAMREYIADYATIDLIEAEIAAAIERHPSGS
jgi:UDP:flavonoid glycosyltransferase YjiC (YdhE family)